MGGAGAAGSVYNGRGSLTRDRITMLATTFPWNFLHENDVFSVIWRVFCVADVVRILVLGGRCLAPFPD